MRQEFSEESVEEILENEEVEEILENEEVEEILENEEVEEILENEEVEEKPKPKKGKKGEKDPFRAAQYLENDPFNYLIEPDGSCNFQGQLIIDGGLKGREKGYKAFEEIELVEHKNKKINGGCPIIFIRCYDLKIESKEDAGNIIKKVLKTGNNHCLTFLSIHKWKSYYLVLASWTEINNATFRSVSQLIKALGVKEWDNLSYTGLKDNIGKVLNKLHLSFPKTCRWPPMFFGYYMNAALFSGFKLLCLHNTFKSPIDVNAPENIIQSGDVGLSKAVLGNKSKALIDSISINVPKRKTINLLYTEDDDYRYKWYFGKDGIRKYIKSIVEFSNKTITDDEELEEEVQYEERRNKLIEHFNIKKDFKEKDIEFWKEKEKKYRQYEARKYAEENCGVTPKCEKCDIPEGKRKCKKCDRSFDILCNFVSRGFFVITSEEGSVGKSRACSDLTENLGFISVDKSNDPNALKFAIIGAAIKYEKQNGKPPVGFVCDIPRSSIKKSEDWFDYLVAVETLKKSKFTHTKYTGGEYEFPSTCTIVLFTNYRYIPQGSEVSLDRIHYTILEHQHDIGDILEVDDEYYEIDKHTINFPKLTRNQRDKGIELLQLYDESKQKTKIIKSFVGYLEAKGYKPARDILTKTSEDGKEITGEPEEEYYKRVIKQAKCDFNHSCGRIDYWAGNKVHKEEEIKQKEKSTSKNIRVVTMFIEAYATATGSNFKRNTRNYAMGKVKDFLETEFPYNFDRALCDVKREGLFDYQKIKEKNKRIDDELTNKRAGPNDDIYS